MKSLYIILLFIPFIILFTSCEKDEPSKVFGTVSVYPNNDPVSDGRITLSAQIIEQASFNNNFQLIDNVHTNSSGGFEITFDPVRASIYRIEFTHNDYREKYMEFTSDNFTLSKQISMQVVVKAHLDVHIKNQNSPSDSDEFRIRIKGIPNVCQDCSDSTFSVLTGAEIDTTLTYQIAGNDEITLDYTTTDNNGEIFIETIYSNPGENSLTIYY
ncbi:MAG: hypothetical protein PF590_04085 [Candidatus Delongbacteria bacterium]|jgi:hypothetical protein|nr:hypothetical protein [Candidatus Delongbacteria bacterium]